MTKAAVEPVDILSADQARQIVNQIRRSVEDTKGLIVTAYRGRIWLALKYPDWESFCVDELGGGVQVPKAEQDDLIFTLREHGLSTRAIGAVANVDHRTVARHLEPVEADAPPETVGLDGKHYARPPEVREEVMRRLLSGSDTAKDLSLAFGIPESTIANWKKQATKPPTTTRPKFVKPSKALPEMAQMLDGMVSTLPLVDTNAIDYDSLRSWIESMNQSLHKLHRFLREISNAGHRTPDDIPQEDPEERPPEMGSDCPHAPEP